MSSPVGSVRFATEIGPASIRRRRLIPCFAMGHPGPACGRAAQAAAMTARFGSRAGTPPTQHIQQHLDPFARRKPQDNRRALHEGAGGDGDGIARLQIGRRRCAHAVGPGRVPQRGDEVFGHGLRARAVGEKPPHPEGTVDRAPRLAPNIEFDEQILGKKRRPPGLDALRRRRERSITGSQTRYPWRARLISARCS